RRTSPRSARSHETHEDHEKDNGFTAETAEYAETRVRPAAGVAGRSASGPVARSVFSCPSWTFVVGVSSLRALRALRLNLDRNAACLKGASTGTATKDGSGAERNSLCSARR